jgi:hypothetical protein
MFALARFRIEERGAGVSAWTRAGAGDTARFFWQELLEVNARGSMGRRWGFHGG